MPKITYKNFNFRAATLATIHRANQIIAQYQAQGFDLTLRQLYYQFVARGLIPNRDTEYDKLGSIINDARLAGMIDWDSIEDRTRSLRGLTHWDDPTHIMESVAAQFRRDLWRRQEYRPEVWIEKDALVGVIQGVCDDLDVSYFSCRGYTSQSEMWVASQRLERYIQDGQTPVIFHFGDHDPSGIDMSRDIQDRLALFMGGVEFERLALNMDQVQQYQPPPNPAKVTDSRSPGYIRLFGNESWELDALEPQVLADLIRDAILNVRDDAKWEEDEAEIKNERETLKKVAQRWNEITIFVGGTPSTSPPRRTANDIIHEEGQCEYQEGSMRCIERAAADEGQRCASCGGLFCSDHIVPDWHDCSHALDEEEDDESD